jgi:hypothetical protein
VALIESFRRWGILPKGLRTLSEEELRWSFTRLHDKAGYEALTDVVTKLRTKLTETLYCRDRKKLFELLRDARSEAHKELSAAMADRAEASHREKFNRVTGLNIAPSAKLEGIRMSENGLAHFEVHALRPALRVTPDNAIQKQLIMILTQRRDVSINPAKPEAGSFEFRGGATLIFDLEGDQASLRYAITRPIDNDERLADAREYRQRLIDEDVSLRATYFGPADGGDSSEPLALLHSDS